RRSSSNRSWPSSGDPDSRHSPGTASRSALPFSMQWLRRSFIAGFFVTVPLFVSVAAIIWIFGVVDGATTPIYDQMIGRRIPGLGLVSTAIAIILVGAFARNVIGSRILTRNERSLLKVPLFRTIYPTLPTLITTSGHDTKC